MIPAIPWEIGIKVICFCGADSEAEISKDSW
jgi:hypothetical protein